MEMDIPWLLIQIPMILRVSSNNLRTDSGDSASAYTRNSGSVPENRISDQ